MTRLIVHIGPLIESSGKPGLTAYFLVPGNPEDPMALARNLADALPDLRRMAGGDPLACEPALEAQASRLGLAIAPLNREARDMLALIALDIADRSTFAEVGHDGLIGRFCEAAAAFEQALQPDWPPRWLEVRISGSPTPRMALVLGGPGLAVLDTLADPSRADAQTPEAITDGLGAVFAPGDQAIADALHRAFALRQVPQPFRVDQCNKFAVTDVELALLTAVLLAVSRLPRDVTRTSHAHVEAEDITVEVTINA
jgi:hypothetical protein